MWILNMVLALITLLALLSPYISPQYFWFFGFLGYGIPLLLLINAGFIIWWLFKKSMFALLPAVMVIAGGIYLDSAFGFHATSSELKDHDLTVVSYNVRYFNTGNDSNFKNEAGLLQMVRHISQLESDILCFQEFYNNNGSSFANTRKYFQYKGYGDFHFGDINISNSNNAGLAIFSRFPIIKKGTLHFSGNTGNKAIFSDLVAGNDTIRFYNVHLHSLNLSDGYDFYQLFDQLKSGFQIRPLEVNELINHMHSSPYPLILCGDFNDLPYSYTYQRFRGFLQNSFEKAGAGFGWTYNGNIPFVRIDNQFSDFEFTVLNHGVLTDFLYTDHFPISVTYKFSD